MPRKVCQSPLVTVIFPNFDSMSAITSSMTLSLSCVIALSSTHHPMVNCFPLIFLLATHGSYLFSLRPISFKVPLNNLYHKSADFKHPYRALARCRYITRFPFLICINFLYSGFTLHIISSAVPVNFTKTKSSMSACRYAPATSAVATFRRSFAATDIICIRGLFAMVGDAHCSFGMCSRWGLPSTHDRPFTRPSRFNFTRSIGFNAFRSSSSVIASWSTSSL
mmetsp:Transcript_5587/g.8160  ORF Transcript_5587/g.8160 Transcript_5587/m.8160 type:complete len:223 (-) Transcript_5587:639-1307(-)